MKRIVSTTAAATAVIAALVLAVSAWTTATEPMQLAGAWEYRWYDETQWKPIDVPSNPPGRNDRQLLYLRTELPESVGRDPATFIQSIDTIATVFADGREIYSHGNPLMESERTFRGWPWHLFSVPPGTKTLSLLVFSDYRDIGLWGRIMYGEKSDIAVFLYKRDFVRIGVAAISFVLALVLVFNYASSNDGVSYLYLSLVLFTLVLRSITESFVHQELLFAPLAWEYFAAFTNFLLPAVVALFLSAVVTGLPARVMRISFWVLLAFAIGGIVGAMARLYPISSVYVPADVVLVVFIVLAFVLLVRRLFVGSLDMRLLAAGFIGVGAVGVVSVLVVYQVLPWTDVFEDAALAIFGVTLFLTLAVRAATVQRELREKSALLESANAELEQTVAERTRELREEKEKFEQMSITDSLTGLYNRRHMLKRLTEAVSRTIRYGEPLSVVVLDLDHFKSVNDSFGHLYGDSVLVTVSETIVSHLRESDIACRFGGEEFVVVLPNTGQDGAFEVAERIRRTCRDYPWEERRVPVTMSAGIASIDAAGEEKAPETLLSEADQAMYRAKMHGRDRTMRFTEAETT